MPAAATDSIPDAKLYQPLFCPWFGAGDSAFREIYEPIRPYSLVSSDRCYTLYTAARQVARTIPDGQWWECGVYKGGTAMLLAALIRRFELQQRVALRLFDTFAGMPQTDAQRDIHTAGDFADTDEAAVRARLPHAFVHLHRGMIPQTFAGFDQARIALAHIDVDIFRSVLDSSEFIYPRMLAGGFMIFDDYGFPTCPGARQAVDEYFANKPEVPFVLPTGQAMVCISAASRGSDRT